jgi:hypothetical protein
MDKEVKIASVIRGLRADLSLIQPDYEKTPLREVLEDLEGDKINAKLRLHPFGGQELDFSSYLLEIRQYRAA